MAIKDESRSVVRPKKKRKRRVAPVQGEQARGESKVPRRGRDEGITVGRRDIGPRPERPPGGIYARGQSKAGGILGDIQRSRAGHVQALQAGIDPEWQRRWIAAYDNIENVLRGKGGPDDARKAIADLAEDIELHRAPQAGIKQGTDAHAEEDFFIDVYQEAIDRISRQYGVAQSRRDRQLSRGVSENEFYRFDDALDFPIGVPSARRRRRREVARGATFEIPPGIDAAERNRTPYRGSTNPAFARVGYSGDIFSLNRRAELANAAFASQFGYEPSPGLLLDIIRAPIQNDEFEEMFKIPQTFQRARALAAENEARFKAEPVQDLGEGQGVEETLATTQQALARQEQGVGPPLQGAGIVDNLGLPGLALYQIGESLVYAPAGVLMMSKALGYDAGNVVRGDFSGKHSRQMGKDIAKGVYASYQNPEENPGYIILDLFGVLSGGAGAVSRVSRAGRATGIKSKTKALATRRAPETDEVGGEEFLLSENVFAETVQRALNNRRRRGLERRRSQEGIPFAPIPARHKLAGQFTTEAKIGREARARQRVEYDIAIENVRELTAVAGWAINSSRALSKMPRALKRGLSRGEQKAIQVLATDEPGGWTSQLAVHREFHQRQIADGIGDPRAHNRQLGDLDLAEVSFMNPTKRFEEAAVLVREVMTQGELLKISALGLNAATAEARIASYGEVLRGGVPVEGATRLNPDSFYLPSVPRRHARKPVSKFIPIPRPGRWGIPEPRNLPELSHFFSGNSLRWGDFRMDTTTLAGESYSRAVRLVALRGEHQRLLAQATKKQRTEWDVPIRDTDAIPDELRDVVNKLDEGAVTRKDIDSLSPNFQEAIYQHLFPKTEVPGVKWIDSRLIGDAWKYPNEPGFGVKLATAINDPIRTVTLFLRPAYGVGNLLGNSAMLMMQSMGAPNNLRKAVQGNKLYGEKNMRTIEALVAEGKSLSFSPDDLVQTKISRTLAHGWNALVDRKFRVAAFIHEMERRGYKSQEDVSRLLDPTSQDDKIKKHRVEISRRANKAMVEFNNLTHFEKNTMRHLIFVYPWVSRSVVWSLKTMVDHPLKTWSLVQLGKEGEKHVDERMWESIEKQLGKEETDVLKRISEKGEVPLAEWVKNQGYAPLHLDNQGLPVVVNPQSLNTFSTFPEILRIGKSLRERVRYDSPEDLSSPALDFGIHAYTGRDQFGTLYDEGRVEGALLDTFRGLPHVRAYERAKGQEAGLPPEKRQSFVPRGFIDAYGPLVVGGLMPRTLDTEALVSDWFRDQPKEIRDGRRTAERARLIRDRLSVERRAIMQIEAETAKILGKSIPQEVRDALELNMRFAERYADVAIRQAKSSSGQVKDTPLDPAETLSSAGKAMIQIQVLGELGRINEDEQVKLTKEATAAALKGKTELKDWRDQFGIDYLNAKELQDWYGERDEILDLVDQAPAYLDSLRKSGLWQGGIGQPKQEDLLKVGREYVNYDREMRAREDDTGARSDLTTLDNSLDRAWLDEQDKPVNIDGKKYPSPVRLAWAKMAPEDRLEKKAEYAVASWDTLSNFEKELVGKKVAPKVSYGWVVANTIMDGFRGNLTAEDVPAELRDYIPEALPDGQREIDRQHKLDIARYVDKNFAPGFYKDYLFSIQPKFQRIRVLPIITKSKAKDEWSELMQAAGGQYALIKRAREGTVNYTITGIQDGWDDYAKNTLYPYIQENSSETFRNELELLGGVDFLRTLIAD